MADPWPHLEVEWSNTCQERATFWCHTACVFYSDVNVQQTNSALWRPSWKLWMAVQVTTCRGRGHIVAAALQATQLVEEVKPQHVLCESMQTCATYHWTHALDINYSNSLQVHIEVAAHEGTMGRTGRHWLQYPPPHVLHCIQCIPLNNMQR